MAEHQRHLAEKQQLNYVEEITLKRLQSLQTLRSVDVYLSMLAMLFSLVG